MNELDERIRVVLAEVVGGAPEPVSVEDIAALVRGHEAGDASGLPTVAAPAPPMRVPVGAVAAGVAAMAVMVTLALANLGPSSGSAVDLRVDDSGAGDVVPATTGAATSGSVGNGAVSVTISVGQGQWVSEIVPALAEQLPSVTADQLWSALDSATPSPPFNPSTSGVDGPMAASISRWEGLLLPGTYTIDADLDADSVVEVMHDEFLEASAELGYSRAPDAVGLSPYEVVVVASLIEAEGVNDDDAPKVARVIYNRMAEALAIGIDQAYVYEAQDRDVEITSRLLTTDGPYALRLRTGLPPTPIAAPGEVALAAAIAPASGSWLFYNVIDGDENLAFATTIEEFIANKREAAANNVGEE